MIDTIIMRLHNLRKYELLIRRLEIKNNPGYSSETAKVEMDEVQKLRGMGYKSPKQIIDILKINKTGEFLVKTQVGKQMNASNHYAFTYFIDWTKDHIEFNFSVPKYKYGSNVLMFVEHNLDRDFAYCFNSTMEYNIKRAPSLIISFIKNFWKKEFILEDIDFRDVEINRIDVCFNQVFSTKDEALRYLEYQKRLKKKYGQEEEGVMRQYATSFMYVTKRYSAKIYHKGAEYLANDLKEHLKINKAKGVEYFKTGQFQNFSDRILRYELTIRNSYINYLYKHSLFRKNCPHFKIDYKSYLRVVNVMQKNDRISKRAGTFTSSELKEKFLKNNPYEIISKNDKLTHKYVSKTLEMRTFFMLDIGEKTALYNEQKVNYTRDRAKFSQDIIRLCLKKLVSFIDEFQVKELPDEDQVSMRIDIKNSFTNILPKSEMIYFYSLLQKYGSFKEAARYGGLSRATMFRYKKRFKEIGIHENSIKPMADYTLPTVKTDFQEYHSSLMVKYSILRNIRIN